MRRAVEGVEVEGVEKIRCRDRDRGRAALEDEPASKSKRYLEVEVVTSAAGGRLESLGEGGDRRVG
jgi:hypothetical protein